MPIGILTNFFAIVIGGLLGALAGNIIPDKFKTNLPGIFGFAAIAMGGYLMGKTDKLTVVILSLLLGACTGELLDLERRLHRNVQNMGKNIRMFDHTPEQRDYYVTLFILFCAGGMGIFGALKEGIDGDSSILQAKSVMDFFTAMVFASSVGLSIVSIGFFQIAFLLGLYSCAHLIIPFMTPESIGNFTAVGGIISMAAGFKLAKIKHMEVTNLLPALVFVLPLSRIL